MIDMRTRSRRAAGVLLTLVVGLGMTACVGGEPLPTLPPTPDSTPIFGSEEEALAAAEAAYAAYLEMSNLISSEGGVEPERIAPFVTEAQLQDELAGSSYLRDNGIRAAGNSVLGKVLLQQYDELGSVAEVAAYICVDVGAVRILDANGSDVTPEDRPDVIALEVLFQSEDSSTLIADSNQWPDSELCS